MNMITAETSNTDRLHERLGLRLPEKARRKMEGWRQDAADADALRYADSEKLIELRNEKGAAQRELQELERANQAGKFYTERQVLDEKSASGFRTEQHHDTARLEAAQRRVQLAQDQIERLQARMANRSGNPLRGCEAYLRQLPANADLTEQEPPPAARMPDETFPAALERVRNAIDDLKEEARGVSLAPIPAAEAQAQVRKEIAALAERGRPGVLAVLERAGKVRWPTQPLQGVQLTTGDIPQLADVYAFLAFLFPDQMSAALEQVVAEAADDDHALTHEQRRARAKDIGAAVLDLERQEEVLTEEAEAAGILVMRRADADPRAVLHLSGSLPEPRQP